MNVKGKCLRTFAQYFADVAFTQPMQLLFLNPSEYITGSAIPAFFSIV